MSNGFWLVLAGSVWLLDRWMRSELERASHVQDVCPGGPPPEEAPAPEPRPPAPDPHPGFYRNGWGKLTPLGCKMDRYGVCYVRNPQGFGWRELGASPDEPYWVDRLD